MALQWYHCALPSRHLLLCLLLVLIWLEEGAMVRGEDTKPLHTNDPCRAMLHDDKIPEYLDQHAAYLAGSCQQLTRGVVLAWTLEEDNIRLEIHANTEGWVAVGINHQPGMLGADLAVGWVNDSGAGHLYDTKHHDKKTEIPSVDETQNTVLIESREKDSVTSLLFSRPLVTGDKDDLDIKGRVWIVWAYGTEDPEDDSMEFLPSYYRNGATSIRFHTTDNAVPKLGNDEL